VHEATLVVKHTDSSGFHYLNWSPVSLHTSAVEVYFATQVLKSQCPSTFTTQRHCLEYFCECRHLGADKAVRAYGDIIAYHADTNSQKSAT
jgi:hypothetical protein